MGDFLIWPKTGPTKFENSGSRTMVNYTLIFPRVFVHEMHPVVRP